MKCGLDFWATAAGSPVDAAPASVPIATPLVRQPTATVTRSATTIALLAGIAWILSAALIAYLAFLQLQYASAFPADRLADETMGLAIGNGISAAITLFFAGKMLAGPSRRFLLNSAGWGVLSVAWGGLQISQGVTADVFIGATVLAGVAGVLSFVAWIQPTA